jgi:hypothetical protein
MPWTTSRTSNISKTRDRAFSTFGAFQSAESAKSGLLLKAVPAALTVQYIHFYSDFVPLKVSRVPFKALKYF